MLSTEHDAEWIEGLKHQALIDELAGQEEDAARAKRRLDQKDEEIAQAERILSERRFSRANILHDLHKAEHACLILRKELGQA